MPDASEPNQLRARVFLVVTSAISLICLLWVIRGANLGQLRNEVVHLKWTWVTAAVVADLAVYVCQAWRWTLLLRPVARVPLAQAVRAIYVGLFANEVLPLRAGELIRCYLLGRDAEIPFSVTLASALIERVFDGVWLIGCLVVTVRLVVRLPRFVTEGGIFLGALILVCGILLAIAMFWKQQKLDALLAGPWFTWVHTLIEDLHIIGHSRYLYYAALVSLLYLLMQVFPIYALIRAYRHVDYLSLAVAFAMMVMLRMGSIIPQAPGNVGTFQFLTVVGLVLFGVPRAMAGRFSLILWSVVTLPLLLAGFIAMAITGVNVGDLHREARAGMRRPDEADVDVPGPS